jgi:hypothetical protein
MSNNNPSLDPANNGSLAGAIQFAFSKLMQNTDGMMPAQVVSYDRASNRAQVQILITLITTDGSHVPRPVVASVPVMVAGGGGFILSYPIKAGDMGWILASDRDTSNFLQNYTQGQPNTFRVKNFADGLFIPDAMRGFTIDSSNTDNIVLQNLDGSVCIALSATGVTIKSKEISIDMGDAGNVLHLNGSILATGTITP